MYQGGAGIDDDSAVVVGHPDPALEQPVTVAQAFSRPLSEQHNPIIADNTNPKPLGIDEANGPEDVEKLEARIAAEI